jgi:S-adenosylmethionine synthetase
MGRKPHWVEKQFVGENGKVIQKQVELFTWEKLDKVEQIKQAFAL